MVPSDPTLSPPPAVRFKLPGVRVVAGRSYVIERIPGAPAPLQPVELLEITRLMSAAVERGCAFEHLWPLVVRLRPELAAGRNAQELRDAYRRAPVELCPSTWRQLYEPMRPICPVPLPALAEHLVQCLLEQRYRLELYYRVYRAYRPGRSEKAWQTIRFSLHLPARAKHWQVNCTLYSCDCTLFSCSGNHTVVHEAMTSAKLQKRVFA